MNIRTLEKWEEGYWLMVCIWTVLHRFMCVNTWSPAGVIIWEGYGTFWRWGLAGESESLGTGIITYSPHPSSVHSLLPSWVWMKHDEPFPTPAPYLPRHEGHYPENRSQDKASFLLMLLPVKYFVSAMSGTATVVLKYSLGALILEFHNTVGVWLCLLLKPEELKSPKSPCKEMVRNITYPDLTSTCCIHALRYHTVPHMHM